VLTPKRETAVVVLITLDPLLHKLTMLMPPQILANIAIPSFFPYSVGSLVGLFAIAALEAIVLSRVIGLGYRKSYETALYANLLTTFVGIPLAWILWLLGLLPTAWGLSLLGFDLHPMVGAVAAKTVFVAGTVPVSEWDEVAGALALILLLIPFFIGSVWVELRVISKRWPDQNRQKLRRAVLGANACSYAILLILGAYVLLAAVVRLPVARQEIMEGKARLERRQEMRKKFEERLESQEMRSGVNSE